MNSFLNTEPHKTIMNSIVETMFIALCRGNKIIWCGPDSYAHSLSRKIIYTQSIVLAPHEHGNSFAKQIHNVSRRDDILFVLHSTYDEQIFTDVIRTAQKKDIRTVSVRGPEAEIITPLSELVLTSPKFRDDYFGLVKYNIARAICDAVAKKMLER